MLFAIIMICSVILSLVITPNAVKLGIMDNPGYRKIHTEPVPKAGGIGVFVPIIAIEIVVLFLLSDLKGLTVYEHITVIFATLILVITGVIDDKFDLNPKLKLLIQFLTAAATIFAGFRFHIFHLLLLDIISTVVFIIGIINAVNLLDGLDGLVSGTAIISAVGFGVVGLIYQADFIIFLSVLIIGSCLGFLKYNFWPAKIFMGDTGSMPLGYNLAVLGILCENVVKGGNAIVIPVFLLGIFIYDTLLSIFRRLVNRKPLFQPDRSHSYNLIMDVNGISHKNTVLIIYSINTILTAISIMLVFYNGVYRAAAVLLLAITAVFLSWRMKFVQ